MRGWNFPLTGGGQEFGINQSGIQTFKSGMDKSLAREVIQNSLDARDSDKKPVHVRFVKFEISKDEIPGFERLEDIFVKARKYYSKDEGADKFYKEAIQVMQGSIPCIRISDYNTLGLQGNASQRDRSTFYSLIRAEGVSNKVASSGGSFGIGKAAPFTVSSLRTVFYSTYNIDKEFKLMGVSRLTTFEDSPSEKRQNVGFFGDFNETKLQVDEISEPDPSLNKFNRNAEAGAGTDITVLGYKIKGDWTESLLNAVLNDFYPAIHFNNLVVEIIDSDKSIVVDRDSIGDLMSEYAANEGDSYPYYQALVDPDYDEIIGNVNIIGKCSLFIKKNDGYPSRIQMARSPKMIVKNQPFGSPEPYAGLLICDDEKGNALLRNLEPPEHNDWKPALWEETEMVPAIKGYGRKIMRELNAWIRARIDEISETDEGDSTEIEGLGEYLPDQEESDYGKENIRDALLPDKTAIENLTKKKTVSKPSVSIVKPVVPGGDIKTKAIKSGSRSKGTSDTKSSIDDDSSVHRILTSSIISRSREISKGNGREYVISIIPNTDVSGGLKVVAFGEYGKYDLNILTAINKNSQKLSVEGSMLKDIVLTKGVPELITIKIDDNERYAIGIEDFDE